MNNAYPIVTIFRPSRRRKISWREIWYQTSVRWDCWPQYAPGRLWIKGTSEMLWALTAQEEVLTLRAYTNWMCRIESVRLHLIRWTEQKTFRVAEYTKDAILMTYILIKGHFSLRRQSRSITIRNLKKLIKMYMYTPNWFIILFTKYNKQASSIGSKPTGGGG